jgi:hypothetical protein
MKIMKRNPLNEDKYVIFGKFHAAPREQGGLPLQTNV